MEQSEIDEIKEILEILKSEFKEFSDGQNDFSHGRNAKIRKEGQKQMIRARDLMIMWIERNDKVYRIASGGERPEGFYRKEYFYSTFSGRLAKYEIQKIIDEVEKLIPQSPEFILNMNNCSDPRFTKNEIENFMKDIYNASFTEIDEFYYEPKYQQIHFAAKDDSILDKALFAAFINNIEESNYGQCFTW